MTAIILSFFGLLRAVAWPLVVFAIALAYKPELTSFLPKALTLLLRSRELEIFGFLKLKVDGAEKAQITSELTTIVSGSGSVELKDIPGLSRTTAMATLERQLHTRLLLIQGATPVEVLVRNLAQAQLEAAFGLVYAGIFGSQIEALKSLESRRKIPTDEIYSIYLQFETKFPEFYLNYKFHGWISFLKTQGLLTQFGDTISITDLGDDFLSWLQARTLLLNKPW